MHYVDVHTHLTHQKFRDDKSEVIARAKQAGLSAIVVNGLEPQSNREILQMAQQDPTIKAALGIYPTNAVNGMLPKDFPHLVDKFNVDEEIKFIADAASKGQVFAIGECGLDGHWLGADTFAEQERVFESLIEVAARTEIALIIHTRKLEQRSMEILRHHRVKRVNFHCFGGRTKWALQGATQDGWWFSIPANAARSESFTKMLRELPPERLLTETDAPYLPPVPGMRNEPAHVVETVNLLAKLRGWSVDQARERIWSNFQELFRVPQSS